MISDDHSTRVPWIRPDGSRPLCDVPWLGTSIVQSDGSVNFCCFSSTTVGNVNEQSFQEIWNGSAMIEIRESLSQGRLPAACRSTSCPMFRGDDLHYLFDRMEGPHRFRRTGTHDPHRRIREQLAGTTLVTSRDSVRIGGTLNVALQVRYRGEPLAADLFVGIVAPDGTIRFLPEFEDYAIPLSMSLELNGTRDSREIPLFDRRVDMFGPPGVYEFCAALFDRDSNPNLPSNCYWAESTVVNVNPVHPVVAWGRRVSAVFNGWQRGDSQIPCGGVQ